MAKKPRSAPARNRNSHSTKPNASGSAGETGPRGGVPSPPTPVSLPPAVETERNTVPLAKPTESRPSRFIPDADIALYLEKLSTWAEHQGKHVLIHVGKIHGFYSSRQDALAAGFERFGHVAFLVKQIDLDEKPRPLIGVVL